MDADRIERERDYHNRRFTEETRKEQGKYYFALKGCNDRYEEQIFQVARGADVLDYGCAKGDWSIPVAQVSRSLVGIDISEVAVADAAAAGRAAGLSNLHFLAMNAEVLDFADESFDLVFGSGILHHLDLARAYGEIARVLRPGGRAIFKEPLGHNLAFNLYRALTPDARTEDEHPLVRADIAQAQAYFSQVDCDFFGLATLAAVPFRESRWGEGIYDLTASVDGLLTRAPWVRWQAWYTLMVMRK
jgi:SAM-dependent methyltransferase